MKKFSDKEIMYKINKISRIYSNLSLEAEYLIRITIRLNYSSEFLELLDEILKNNKENAFFICKKKPKSFLFLVNLEKKLQNYIFFFNIGIIITCIALFFFFYFILIFAFKNLINLGNIVFQTFNNKIK